MFHHKLNFHSPFGSVKRDVTLDTCGFSQSCSFFLGQQGRSKSEFCDGFLFRFYLVLCLIIWWRIFALFFVLPFHSKVGFFRSAPRDALPFLGGRWRFHCGLCQKFLRPYGVKIAHEIVPRFIPVKNIYDRYCWHIYAIECVLWSIKE